MGRSNRWLIFAPVAILALFAPSANAEPIAGLQTTYYTIDSVPPTRSDNIYTVCGSEVENNINRSYDGEPYLDCTGDLFMVHMTGFIEIPVHDTIEFWLATDDGGNINIDGNEWGYWNDQGCSATESGQIDISAGSQPLDLYMYENGGGTCVMLAWNIDNTGWVIVPDEAFTTETSWETTTTSTTTTTTTTTTAPSTTVPVTNPSTTTTLQTTTTSNPPTTETTTTTTTTTEPPIPTTTLPQVPNGTSTTSSTSTTTIPETVDTVAPEETVPEASTTTTTEATTTTVPETTTIPEVVDTIPPVVDTIPDTTVPDTTVADTTVPDTLPDEPETPVTLPPEVIEELPAEVVEALLEAIDNGEPLTEEQFDTVVDTIADLAPEEAVALITQILATTVTPDQAEELASNPDVLAVITEEQATEIFETIDVTELDNTQIAELTEAIQGAPLAVQEAFENTIDIFGGFDDYVPTGSNIPVGERRTLIAIAAGATLTAASSKIKGK